MFIGILLTGIIENSKIGFYNSQEIGLSKELEKYCDRLIIYKATKSLRNTELVAGCDKTLIREIPVKSIGTNGIMDCKELDTSLDVLLYFSDTQLMVPTVNKWCNSNNILLIPYIGVIESHSANKIKQDIMNIITRRNIKVYKDRKCLAKTPYVMNKMSKLGINNVELAPVGLDTSLLNSHYRDISKSRLRIKYGYNEKDTILLFVGQMRKEKKPLKMVELFKNIPHEDNDKYNLLMVGKGELLEKVKDRARGLNIKIIESMPNKDMWELYCLSDFFINLNTEEIFGMSLLEAMYYELTAIAWNAPGPNCIIENGKSGYIINDDESFYKLIRSHELVGDNIHNRIVQHFTWKQTAEIIYEKINNQLK